MALAAGSSCRPHQPIYAASPLVVGLPGVEVHTTIIDNLLKNNALVFLGPISGFALAIAVPSAITVADYTLFFLDGRLLGPAYLIASLLTLLTTVTLTNYLVEGRRKGFIRRTFSRYIDPLAVNQLLKTPVDFSRRGNPGGDGAFLRYQKFHQPRRKDPAGRTQLIAQRLFFAPYRNNHRCMVDKYIGDAIMAVWGAPLDDPRHPENAVRAALAIDAAVTGQSDRLPLAGKPISIGIGINTGKASAGNFGSKDRFAYTVLGDTVNLAARLEHLTRYYQVKIFPQRVPSPPPRSSLQPSLLTAGKNCTASISKHAGIS